MDKKHTCFFQQRGAPLKKGAYGFMRRLFPFVLVSVGILIGCSESSSGGKGGGDNTAPTVSSVSVSNTAPNKLAITFSENVTIAGSADFGFSVVTDSPPPPVITAKEGSGAAWALTLSRAVAAGETLTLTYAGNAVKDTAGNALAAFTGKAIVNNVSGEGAIVESVSITDSLTQLNKGDSHTFHALVTGQNNPSQAVTWTVTGKDAADESVELATGTVIGTDDGRLTIDAEEAAAVLTITATSIADPTKFGSIEIELVAENAPLVTSITVRVDGGGAAAVEKGGTLQLIKDVAVTNEASDAVTWSIEETVAAGTAINTDGLLTVAVGETNATLTVRATSAVENFDHIYGTLEVTVTSPPSPNISIIGDGVEGGNWQDGGQGPLMEKAGNGIYTATVKLIGGKYFKFWNGTGYYSAPSENVAPGATQAVNLNDDVSSNNWSALTTASWTITLDTESLTVTFAPVTDTPSVTSITVRVADSGVAEVEQDGTLQLTAVVIVANGASQAVIWSLEETAAAGTTISASGLLTVAAKETNETLTVRATSTAAGFETIYGSLPVTVKYRPPTVTDVWLSGSMADNWTFPGAAMTKAEGVFTWEGAVEAGATFRFSLEDTSEWYDNKGLGQRYQPAINDSVLTPGTAMSAVYVERNSGDENAWVLESAGYYRIVFNPSVETVTATKLPSTVTSVTITSGPTALAKGGGGDYTAEVQGTNLYDISVTWAVSGNTSSDTTFIGNRLSIGVDETAGSVSVVAASVADPSKQSTALSVTIESQGTVTTVSIVGNGVEGGDWQDGTDGKGSGPAMSAGANGVFTATVKLIGGGYFKFWNGTQYYCAPSLNVAPGANQVVYSSEDKNSFNWSAPATATYAITLDTTKIGNEQQPAVNFTVIPVVERVTVSPKTASVGQGGTKSFTAEVVVSGGAASTVTWSIEGTHAEGTSIDSSGRLTVAPTETLGGNLTIKAVSTADATVSDTATVTVTAATSSANIILSITDTGKNLTFTKNSAPFNGGSLGTISKTGGTKTMTVGVAAQTGYTYEWVINGAYATKRTGTSITLNAADFTLGTFTLTLIAIDGGNVKWSSDKLMSFTVEK